MAWIYLILAAGLEACWMFSLKFLSFTKFKILTFQNFTKSEGLSIWLPLAGYIIFGITNTYFFSLAMKNIPTAIAFTIWTAISILFIKMVEVVFLAGKLSLPEIGFLVVIMIGIVGLKMVSET
ncbi:quaternary ammonium compound-resistance protein SugE [Arcicella aurantiaca]|uniref:Guanidinium exporter n=1 Tax=Arcicella aurantiaca TaxID=591202 RepID=A0A316EAA8_9BACT|nr:SMR family transporter [Arcicella aurantiaca]PWK27688.1 quaternary ammonium compound-resistance protein SugE [Arcicella aurantiaca]